jgi:hypothetical protein
LLIDYLHRFQTTVTSLRYADPSAAPPLLMRSDESSEQQSRGWNLTFTDIEGGNQRVEYFDKVVLCMGVGYMSNPGSLHSFLTFSLVDVQPVDTLCA